MHSRVPGDVAERDAARAATSTVRWQLLRPSRLLTRCPMSNTRRWSRVRQSPSGMKTGLLSGPARSGRSVFASSWLRRSASVPTKRAWSFPTRAGDSGASTRAKSPSRLRDWPERPASRFRSAGLGRKSSPGPTSGPRRLSRRGRASAGRRSSPGTSLLTTQVRRQSRRPTPCRMFARSTSRATRPCARVPTEA